MQYQGIKLPKDKDAVCRILKSHATRCESYYLWRRMTWLLAWYYLNGYRNFDVVEASTGKIRARYLDKGGKIPFQSTELLFHINQVVGQIQGMDFRPLVKAQGVSLSSQRDKALGQITLNSMVSEDHLRTVQENWATHLVTLGCVGLSGDVHQHPTIGLSADLEVIHPRELFPFPAVGFDHTQTSGIMRQRWVPVDRLRSKYGARKVNAGLTDKIEWISQDPGEPFTDPSVQDDSSPQSMPIGANTAVMEDSDDIELARVTELWLSGPSGTVSRYICTSGDMLFEDVDLSDASAYQGISVARFMNNGSWYGAGLFDFMFHQHQQLEELSRRLYQNVMSLDSYGVVVLPQGTMNQQPLLKDIGAGLKYMFVESDSLVQSFNPFVVQPHNAGEFPGKVAAFARDSMKQVHPLPDILSEKGRVDSASGLSMLMEQAQQALTTPTNNVINAWGQVWKGIHQKALFKILQGTQTLPLTDLSLDLAGAKIDAKAGTITFGGDANPFPDITRLSYTIKSAGPRSMAARKAEALDLVQRSIVTNPIDFKLVCWEEGLDFAMYTKDDYNAIEMGILAILTLFNDGDEPGEIILTPHTTKPPVVLRLLESFTVGRLFMSASPAVHNAFKTLRLTLMSWQGTFLPPGVPAPEEAAMDTQQPTSPSSMGRGSSAAGQPTLRMVQ